MSNERKEKYLRPEEVSKLLKVTVRTLYNWDRDGKITCIKTNGGHRRFLESEILARLGKTPPERIRERICYCRVSSPGQKEDLERQVQYFQSLYPNHRIISDIGSGINFKRKGLETILDLAIRGDIEEVVVTHKDRLCRFGFELIERIISSTNGKIVVLDKKETSPERELTNDLITIITVFSSRLYGLRSHSLKKEIRKQATQNPKDPDLSN